tara:strand:- start:36409 stop:36642 length:234 start_codon:yes stop_codon:yes gene_type:complete
MKLNEEQKEKLFKQLKTPYFDDMTPEDVVVVVEEFLADIETPFNIKPVSQEDVDKAIAKAKGGTKKFLQGIIDKIDG